MVEATVPRDKPLIVQSDRTLLLDVHSPSAEECRNALLPFAELEQSPEHLHTYRITSLSLWNAASAGFSADTAIEVLSTFSRYPVPQAVSAWVKDTAERFGTLRLTPGFIQDQTEFLYLVCKTPYIFKELSVQPLVKKILIPCAKKELTFAVRLTDRGTLKQNLLKIGWPVKDEVPLVPGDPLSVSLRETTLKGAPFLVRSYQKDAASALIGDNGPGTGFGTIVLPCGSGKTIVGMEIISRLKTNTLIITTNISAVHQWIDELLDKTTLTKEQIAEYSGETKTVCPVTVATYQILTWRKEKTGPYPHFELFRKNNWGLIIYDEVHMLPAPVFRVVAELQAVRRVGLTATLVREDGCEGHVFSLVGPKRYDVPWKELEKGKWIATAECVEVRLGFSEEREMDYAVASTRMKYRIASENPLKNKIVKELTERFSEDTILVIGQYVSQLEALATMLNAPIITGKTPNAKRDAIYKDFKTGSMHVLVVSKVANFAIDLPDASMAIQVSGTFGSRQEEAQRLGRILRPKNKTARFFTLVTRNTVEEDFGSNRQKFLAEQGYAYRIIRYENDSSFEELDTPLALEQGGSL